MCFSSHDSRNRPTGKLSIVLLLAFSCFLGFQFYILSNQHRLDQSSSHTDVTSHILFDEDGSNGSTGTYDELNAAVAKTRKVIEADDTRREQRRNKENGSNENDAGDDDDDNTETDNDNDNETNLEEAVRLQAEEKAKVAAEAAKAAAVEGETTSTQKNDKLNIVFLYGDDWRFDSLGAVNPIVHTPNLDKLASQGMLFSQNAVTTSICWISRGCFATGQHYAKHKQLAVGGLVPWYNYWNETVFGKLKDNGYKLGMVGKWHSAKYPDNSFDYARGYFGFHIQPGTGKHITDMNEDHALEFLKQSQTKHVEKPFALFVNFFAPHHHDGQKEQYFPSNETKSLYQDVVIPFAPTATQESWEKMPPFFSDGNDGRIRWRLRFDTKEKAQRMMKNYYRLISGVDKTVGKIIEDLEKRNLTDNTLIVFTTDNGYYHAEHGLADKFYAHQESIRVPLIIKDPRMNKALIGTRNDDFTLSIDLAPTILKAAGLDVPNRMQGVDMSPLYTAIDKPTWRNQFYYEYPGIPGNNGHLPVQAIVRKDYKYMYWPKKNFEELYNIPTDRYEQYDLARNFTFKSKLEEMRNAFKVEQASAQ